MERTKKIGIFDRIKMVYTQIQAVCCFTSLAAPLAIVILLLIGAAFPSISNFWADFVTIVFGCMYVVGLISAVLACPVKWVGLFLTMAGCGFSIGLCFLVVGALVGAAIAIALFAGLFLFIAPVITIPHYFSEVQYSLTSY